LQTRRDVLALNESDELDALRWIRVLLDQTAARESGKAAKGDEVFPLIDMQTVPGHATPLDLAAAEGRPRILAELVKRGASTEGSIFAAALRQHGLNPAQLAEVKAALIDGRIDPEALGGADDVRADGLRPETTALADGEFRTLGQLKDLVASVTASGALSELAGAPLNFEKLHWQTRGMSDEADVVALVETWLGTALTNPQCQGGKLYPLVKPKEYMDNIAASATGGLARDEYSVPLDPATKHLHLLATRRTEKTIPNGVVAQSNALVLRGGRREFWGNLAGAFANMNRLPAARAVYEDSSSFGSLITARNSDSSILCSMATVSFVDELRRRLQCTATDELVVVPLERYTLYATRSSDPMGCCMLGDYAHNVSADHPDHISSVPFRVLKVDRSASEPELLREGKLPVTWEQYPMRGTQRGTSRDGVVRCPIPRTEAQADEMMLRIMT
jgi:hypothetical protein